MPVEVDTSGHELMSTPVNGSTSYSRPRGGGDHEHDAGPLKKKLKTARDAEPTEQPNGSAGGDKQSQGEEEGERKEEEDVARIAVAPPTAESIKLVHVLQQALRRDWHHNVFNFEDFVKHEQGLRLDHESSICPTYLSKGSCPLGNSCPKRHVPLFQPPPSSASHNRDGTKRTVCKHWLRGLCKKGDGCDYLHEYDMRTMPECRFFATFGFCDMAGGGTDRECLYLHRDPKTKRRECEEYRRGFCPKGPGCSKKHVRRVICPHYLAGFCPKGKACTRGHPKVSRPSTESRRGSPIQTVRPLTAAEAFAPPAHLAERQGRYGGGGGGYNRDDGEEGGGGGWQSRNQGPRQWGGQPQAQQAQQQSALGISSGADQQGQANAGFLPGFSNGASSAAASNDPFAAGALPGFGGAAGGENYMSGAANDYAGGSAMQATGSQPSWQQAPQGARNFKGGAGGGGGGRKKLDLSEVLCFKCGEYGHFANHCPNPNKPGQRGSGMERGRGGNSFNRDGQGQGGGGGGGGGGDGGYGGGMGGQQQY